jgi:PAS domain-containing protein
VSGLGQRLPIGSSTRRSDARSCGGGHGNVARRQHVTTAAGLALLLLGVGRTRLAARLGSVVALIAGATLLQHISGLEFGIDTLLLFDRPWGRRGTLVPGRMGLPGSFSWTLIGSALILINRGTRARQAAAGLGLLIMAFAALSLTGYLFGAQSLYTVPTLTAIAFQTATLILAAGLGIFLALPEQQPMRRVLGRTAASMLVRRLLPFVVGLPLVLGFLRVYGQYTGLYDTGMGTAMLVLALIGLLCAVLWWGSSTVAEYELKLERASQAARASLAASEERYRSLVSIITDVPWTTDASGAFVTFQPAWATYTGQSWDEMRGIRMGRRHPSRGSRPRARALGACVRYRIALRIDGTPVARGQPDTPLLRGAGGRPSRPVRRRPGMGGHLHRRG